MLSMHLRRNDALQPAWAIFAYMVLGGLLSIEHLVELFIIVPHMPPFLALTFSYETDSYGVLVINTYRMESLAAMWTLLRMYKVIMLVRDEVLQQYTMIVVVVMIVIITILNIISPRVLFSGGHTIV